MVIKTAYLKVVRPNQSSLSLTSAQTAYFQMQNPDFQPLGGVRTAAPSTVIIDRDTKIQYYINLPYSTTNQKLSAVTSTSDAVVLL